MTLKVYTMTSTKKNIGNLFSIVFTQAVICLMAAVFIPGVMATAPVNLGTAGNFAVLANTGGVTINIGSTVFGNVSSASGSFTNDGTVTGTIYSADSVVAEQAQTDLVTAMSDAASRTYNVTYPPNTDLSGKTLYPGVYNFSSSLALSTGDLTLNPGTNGSASVWIFQVGSTLGTTGGHGTVLTGGAKSNNVFWLVGSTANIGSGSAFNGTIMAAESITLDTGATLTGRALANAGAVTLTDTNTVTASGNDQESYSLTVLNSTLSFGTFAIGSNVISPTSPDQGGNKEFGVIQMSTSDNTWNVQVNGGTKYMTSLHSYTFATPMTIQNATDLTASGIAGKADPMTLTTTPTRLMEGTQPIGKTNIPLCLQQTVESTDTADTGYSMTVTVTYADGA